MTEPAAPDLTLKSDFELLNALAGMVSKERSQPLQKVAWEIMRRYTAHLEAGTKPVSKDYSSTLRDARWGDAKRVEQIFGIKRNVLLRLAAEGTVPSVSLQSIGDGAASAPARAKRLYCLLSLAEHFTRMTENIKDS